jgi:hypothetical protein
LKAYYVLLEKLEQAPIEKKELWMEDGLKIEFSKLNTVYKQL